jgi:WD40 repeat protein
MELRNSRRSKVELSGEKSGRKPILDVELLQSNKKVNNPTKYPDRYFLNKPRSSLRINEELDDAEQNIVAKTLKLSYFGQGSSPPLDLSTLDGVNSTLFPRIHFKKEAAKRQTKDIVTKASGIDFLLSGELQPKLMSWLPGKEDVLMVNGNTLILHKGPQKDRYIEKFGEDENLQGVAVDWFIPELFYLTDNRGFFYLTDMQRGKNLRSIRMNPSYLYNDCVYDFARYEHQGMSNVVLAALNQHIKVIDLSSRDPFVQSFGLPPHIEGIERVLVIDEFKAITVGKGGINPTVWDLRQTGQYISFKERPNNSKDCKRFGQILSLDFNPQNSSMLAVATTEEIHLMNFDGSTFKSIHSVPQVKGVVNLTWHQDGRISTIHTSPYPGICLWKESDRRSLEITDQILASDYCEGEIVAAVASKDLGRAITLGSFDFYRPKEPVDNYAILSF